MKFKILKHLLFEILFEINEIQKLVFSIILKMKFKNLLIFVNF